MTEVESHYALDADPAANPNQPPPGEQEEHKTGAKQRVANVKEVADGDSGPSEG
jgi:hypothetical protein